MKKLFSLVALLALVLLPLNVKAESTLEWKISDPDSNGVYTVQLFMKVAKDTPYERCEVSIIGNHALIQTTTGSDMFQKDETSSIIQADGSSASLITTYKDGIYMGTGESIKVGEFTYVHDSSYQGTEACTVDLSLAGGTSTTVTENKVKNEDQGSFISYVGIGTGILLIAAAYIISRRSNKLYKM